MKIPKEAKIGFTVTIAIAALIWGMNFLKGINILSSKKYYYVVYEKIEGLLKANPIYFKGYKVGYVEDISFVITKSKDLLIELAINEDLKIPKNSKVNIVSSDIMGSKALELVFSDSINFHNQFDTLHGDVEGSLQEQVSIQMLPLKNKAEDLMYSIESVMAVIQNIFNENFRDNFAKSIENIKTTISNLEKSSYTLDTILYNEKDRLARIFYNIESISINFEKNNENLSTIISNFEAISDTLARLEVKSTINKLDIALNTTNEIIDKINSGKGTLGLLLHNDTLYNHLESASKELDALLGDIKKNPKKYMHFSVIDFGRKIYVLDEEEKKKLEEKSKKKK